MNIILLFFVSLNLLVKICLFLIIGIVLLVGGGGGNNDKHNSNLSSSLVLIKIQSRFESDLTFCTGTIISDTLVLTAAICFKYFIMFSQDLKVHRHVTVYIKVQNESDIKNAKGISVKDFFVSSSFQENFRNKWYYFLFNQQINYVIGESAALVMLSTPINLKEMEITPAKLIEFSDQYPKTVLIAGYRLRLDENNKTRSHLNWANVEMLLHLEYNNKKIIYYDCDKYPTLINESSDIGGPALDENNNILGVYAKENITLKGGCVNLYINIVENYDFLKFAKQQLLLNNKIIRRSGRK